MARPFQDLHHVECQRRKGWMPVAASEKDPGISRWHCARLVKQGRQPPSNEGIISQAIVGSDIRFPYLPNAWRLGPETQDVMIVVFQNNSATRFHRVHHVVHDSQWVGNMFEDKAGVSQVKGTPFILAQRQRESVTAAKIHQSFFPSLPGEADGLGALTFVSLTSYDVGPSAGRARQQARKLAKPAADIENMLAAAQSQFLQARLI